MATHAEATAALLPILLFVSTWDGSDGSCEGETTATSGGLVCAPPACDATGCAFLESVEHVPPFDPVTVRQCACSSEGFASPCCQLIEHELADGTRSQRSSGVCKLVEWEMGTEDCGNGDCQAYEAADGGTFAACDSEFVSEEVDAH